MNPRSWLATLAIVGISSGLWAAPPAKSDALDRLGRVQAVAAQKTENDIVLALRNAQQAKTSDAAIAILKRLLKQLENDRTLPDGRRQKMIKVVQQRIKTYEAGLDSDRLTQKDLDAELRKVSEKQLDEKKIEEREKVRTGLQQIIDLQMKGKLNEATEKSKELLKQFPGNPAVRNTFELNTRFIALAGNKELKAQAAAGFDAGINSIFKSATLPRSEYEFPTDPAAVERWRKRKEREAKLLSNVQLSAKEQAILRALNSPVSVAFKNDRFQDAIEYLATVSGQAIVVDKNDLRDAQIDYDTPVNLAVKGVTMRTVLRKILGDYGLSFIVKDETILIVSQQKARETMTVRTYPVGALVMQSLGGPARPATPIEVMINAANLINTIQAMVEPSSWQANGGTGSITFDPGRMALVISQSAEVHTSILGGGLFR